MTAPDPGLTDLIAAHTRLGAQQVGRYLCLCSWVGDYHDHPAHVALVVEQHANGRIAELEAELEKQKRGGRTLGKAIDRTLKDVVAAVGAEDMIDEDGDGDYAAVFEKLFELRPARDAAIARADKAEATIARVIEGAQMLVESFQRVERGGNHLYDASTHRCADNLALLLAEAQGPEHLRAALEGEQQ